MAAPQASSRLEMLQARFQQKQLQEKEQKLLQLYDQQQQRAYQVVQRGSAGSNSSNHGSSVTHQTVTRSSSTSHTTSTSQGGKVRQMFDERRQTTVKGIDRSYPLEPLENKPRTQTNGNGVAVPSQKNGNLTVNRQSMLVKRVGRADVNSNLNGGKPIVLYHEEITRESFGPQLRQQQEQDDEDENEFGNENYVTRHANGNTRHDGHHQILDQDTIDNNRMMAKLHLMEFDETMKHRIRNDLQSEEFPDELMVDVPDKLPKRTGTKKLSQAEARLERFKNMNARRSNVSKNTTTTTTVTKKRSEPMNSVKSTPRIAKSPSPDPVAKRTAEATNRPARRSVPPSPSNSPDAAPRRASSDMKVQEPKASRRSLPTKTSEIPSKKTTINRKSTDAIDGDVQENGPHSREQIVGTKQDNSPSPKKADVFVIEFEDGNSKEGDVVPPKKPLLRKQSSEKQTSPTHSTRPVSSISSVSSGSSAQGQTSGPRGKMGTRARTPISGTASSKISASGRSAGSASAAENLVPCGVCGRRFAQERIGLHEQICVKTGQKKRKQFDAMLYRVRGTDLEPFVKKGIAKKQPESKPKKPEVKSNWRRKHEDFINAIRSAKQVQAHLAAGGKLSDLPPPPASDTSDYIQCPHCGRKFNQTAAERHIPKCEHMLHNKPVHSRTPKPRR